MILGHWDGFLGQLDSKWPAELLNSAGLFEQSRRAIQDWGLRIQDEDQDSGGAEGKS